MVVLELGSEKVPVLITRIVRRNSTASWSGKATKTWFWETGSDKHVESLGAVQ